MPNKSYFKNILILVALGMLFFVLGNNILSFTNPDEVFYSQTAREMAQHKTWMVPYLFGQPQFEKPIFTYWCIRLGYLLFGETPFAARFFPALFALIGCLTVFVWINRVFKDQRKAMICALVLMTMGMFIGLGRTVFTDMIFSIWILLAMAFFYSSYIAPPDKKQTAILSFFACSALAVLTKGLLGIVFPLAAIFLFFLIGGHVPDSANNRGTRYMSPYLWGGIVFLLIVLPWYMYMAKMYGHAFIHEFFYNDHIRRILEAEHRSSDRWYFYPMVMVGGTFPWSFLTVGAFFYIAKQLKEKKADPLYLYLTCWVVAMFAIVQVAHSKLASYIFPVFPALAVMVGIWLDSLLKKNDSKILKVFLWISLFQIFLIPVVLELFARGVIKFNYYAYLPDSSVINKIALMVSLAAVGLLVLILKKKYQWGVVLTALQIPLFFVMAMASIKTVEPYVSSQQACEYLMTHYQVGSTLLTSKLYARGTRLYTDKDIAVIDSGDNYFSPHPIPYLNSQEKVLAFLKDNPAIYGLVKDGDLKTLEKYVSGQYHVSFLNKIGDENIIRLSVD
ncbi:MAG: glycosyltransferase family 39 protein [Candidatus Omnitrophica bacterium]|nr:glycosyltransferase family 39 protein [Candidatus Omnitrophota bacterium]